MNQYPKKQGLYDPSLEHDACGVGFIAHIKGQKSHKIVRQGLEILENMTHRGACGCDPFTGDGAGIMVQLPDAFLRKECANQNIELPNFGDYGAGIIFLPPTVSERNTIEGWIESITREEGQRFLGWREVPHDPEAIGEVARSAMPAFKQIFISRGEDTPSEAFERKLYVIRRRLYNKVKKSELAQRSYYYCCSLSSQTMVYKGQLMSEQVNTFYADLSDETFISAIAMVHSRYSTNTFPTWALAHPFRVVAHNGEINTVRGNANWMNTREKQFISEKFGEDIKKIFPTVSPNGSDSATFDNALELLVLAGRDLPHAVMMMIPEAWSGHESMSKEKKDFYEYHSSLMEPWDGPASVGFTDGRYIGAVLDRNGLRPSRYWVTKDDLVIMASESGVLQLPPESIEKKGRLEPGKMFLIDMGEGRIIDDKELKEKYCRKQPYGKWLKDNIVNLSDIKKPKDVKDLDEKTLLDRQRMFGYTNEDVNMILKPMAATGIEATGSMGADTPVAPLSERAQLLYNYFKQLFAQVTNPPIDPIREEVIMAEDVMLGPEQNLLTETPEHCKRLRLKRPILTNEELAKIASIDDGHLKATTFDIVFNKADGQEGLEPALLNVFEQVDAAIESGTSLLVLSDRKAGAEIVPMPSLLVCAGLHHHLIRQGTRTKVSIVLETGEAREMHHFATLIGYGTDAINPYLAYETIQYEIKRGRYYKLSWEEAQKNYIKATRKGLFKIISKMGISTIQSYKGAQIFECLGINEETVEKYFTATPTRIGGIGVKTIAEEMLMRHKHAFPDIKSYDRMLDQGGSYRWRKDGEKHSITPEAVAAVQYAVRSGDYKKFKEYSAIVNDQTKSLCHIRGLLDFKKATPIALEEVESAAEIVKRFATGAMSYGSISKEAHETLAIAMNRLGGFSNTGEGGEDPRRFVKDANGDSRRSRIKQVAQGRFGVTIEYLVNSDQMQIKMAQGAKPGEGGQLPGHKVSAEIAKTRGTTKGVGLISPPPHHDIYSIEDLSQLIYDLKNANNRADVSVKLVSEVGVGTIAAGVSKGKADHLLIAGYEGGTGASPQTSIKHAGLPMELGIAETQQVLVMNDLRGRIRVQVDGQLKTGRDVAIAAMLGGDEFGFATIALISLGCILLRKCHLNACSVGIATQDETLRKKFAGDPEHVVNFFMFMAEEIREIMAELGFRTFDEMVGRVDMLETREAVGHWKAKGIDLTNILHKPDVPEHVAIHHVEKQDHGLELALDNKLIDSCSEAIESKAPVSFHSKIINTDRTVGTMLSAEIARKYGLAGLPENTIQIKFEGSAGQSFGAFLSHGVTFTLEGDSNDYVGKGLSGGKLILYPSKKSTFVPEENILVGNVCLYGATMGEAYFRGVAGERFCVRNSGALTVVEGIGDHGCEYMTGGRIVVLGETGRNFGAGMSGGIAYIWDPKKTFKNHCNMGMVELFDVKGGSDVAELRTLIQNHLEYTGSTVAKKILDTWDKSVRNFVKVYPTDYRRVIEEAELVKDEKVIQVVEEEKIEQN